MNYTVSSSFKINESSDLLLLSSCTTTKLYDCMPCLSIGLLAKSAENPLQSVTTLHFFTLAPIGLLINVDHH
jgi:hypothetical protein